MHATFEELCNQHTAAQPSGAHRLAEDVAVVAFEVALDSDGEARAVLLKLPFAGRAAIAVDQAVVALEVQQCVVGMPRKDLEVQ